MYLLKVTLTAVATPIIPASDSGVPSSAPFQTLVIAPAAHTFNVGDATVTASVGVTVPTTGPPLVIPTAVLTQNLNGWYLFGTSADVVSILVLE
jgi:spore germination protein YaaH